MAKGGQTKKGQSLRYNFGWAGPSTPDIRDLKFMYPFQIGLALPREVDMTAAMPPIYDQGDLGTCGLQTLGGLLEYRERKQGFTDAQTPSRLQMYYDTRVLMGTVNEDSGVHNRTMMKALAANGYCEEKEFWPYTISKFKLKPSAAAYADAAKSRDIKYQKVPQNLDAMRQCLAEGNPIIFGHMVYQSYMDAPEGDVPMPGPGERPVGGHDTLLVGYDDDAQRFISRNSWGTRWGRAGYGSFRYIYATNANLASDFWTVTLVPTDSDQPSPTPTPTPVFDWNKLWEIIKKLIEAILADNKPKIKKAVQEMRKEGCPDEIISGAMDFALRSAIKMKK